MKATSRKLRDPVGWIDGQKGHGFIQPDDGRKDVLVHISAIEHAGLQTRNEDQMLSVTVKGSQLGKPSAINLQAA